MKVSWNSLVVSIIFVITLSTFVMGNDLTKPEYAVILTVNGAIGPATLDYIQTGFNDATMSGASLIVIKMDTPGGLDRSMRDIIQLILASSVPVVTYVSPSGARAASAGTYILYASHIAAMAPGTIWGQRHRLVLHLNKNQISNQPQLRIYWAQMKHRHRHLLSQWMLK